MRAIIKLTETEKKELLVLRQKEKNNKIYRRLLYFFQNIKRCILARTSRFFNKHFEIIK